MRAREHSNFSEISLISMFCEQFCQKSWKENQKYRFFWRETTFPQLVPLSSREKALELFILRSLCSVEKKFVLPTGKNSVRKKCRSRQIKAPLGKRFSSTAGNERWTISRCNVFCKNSFGCALEEFQIFFFVQTDSILIQNVLPCYTQNCSGFLFGGETFWGRSNNKKHCNIFLCFFWKYWEMTHPKK